MHDEVELNKRVRKYGELEGMETLEQILQIRGYAKRNRRYWDLIWGMAKA